MNLTNCRRRSVFGLLFFLTLSALVSAQNTPYKQVSISSPNAASLGKYADIPVNNHTGIPQISLPLCSIKEGGLELPVSLSYHASGLKVMEQASWVGAGWSLNAGGVITRTVQGQPDERLTSGTYSEQIKGHLSDDGYNNYLWQNLNNQSTIYLKDIYSGAADGEPDLFFFNFSGYSGRFYFGDDRIPVIMPEHDIKIEYSYTPGIFKSIESFTITTPDGNKYFFGVTPSTSDTDPVERGLLISNTNGYLNNGRSISSWYLNKVQSADGLHTITLTYQPENYSYFNIGSNFVDEGEGVQNGSDLYKISVEGVRLDNISYSNGNVQFVTESTARQDLSGTSWAVTDDANTQAKALKEIRINNTSGNCTKHTFSYDYFTDNTSTQVLGPTIQSDKKRLKLLSVKQESCDQTVSVPPHTFEYYDELVPRKISFSQDHWGFYNGASNLTTMIPAYKRYTVAGIEDRAGADRDSKWPEMRGGALKKINYPTGGSSEFEFEANTSWVSYPAYNKESRLYFSMGYDGNNTPVTQTFTFTNNPYRITLTNTAQGGYAGVSFSCSPNTPMYAPVGQTIVLNNYFPTGSCNITLSKPDAQSGYGASVLIEEMVPYQVSKNETIGGLRIKKITTTAGPGMIPVVTDYTYNLSNGHSSGILYSKPSYVQVLKNTGPRYVYQTLFANGATWYLDAEDFDINTWPYFTAGGRSAIKSASPILPMSTTLGNHIGYNEVKVSQTGNGYSIYRYYGSNIWDQDIRDVCTRVLDIRSPNPSAPEYPAAPETYDYKRGELQYEGHFDQANHLLKEVNYYPVYQNSQVTTPGIRVYSINAGPPMYMITSAITKYELYSAKKTELSATERTFDPLTNNYIENTTTTLFESPYHAGATTSTSINSKNEQLISKVKYAFDYKPAGCVTTNTCWNDYQAELSNNLVLYGSEYQSCGTNNECRKVAKAMLEWRNLQARKNYAACRRTQVTNYDACFQTAKQSANADLKPILDLQDKFINAPIENTAWRGSNLAKATFSKYDYVTNPSGMPYPSKLQVINIAYPLSSTFTPSVVNGNSLTKDNRYHDEATNKMDNGNPVEFTGKEGTIVSCLWGYNNNLLIAKAIGVPYTTLSAAYTAVGQNLSLLRTYPTLSDALVSTYVYTPGVGMTSEADHRGRTTSYEYDKLNRLVFVRDHDNNILKKICYNYAGQAENCAASCTNTTPDWQNTTTPPTCEQNYCGNTGYQLQEQRDMNPCSPTYNQTQWISTYNPTACTPATDVPITYQNNAGSVGSGFTAVYTNKATNITYTFSIPGSGSGTLGCIPAGNYTLNISKPGNTWALLFGNNCSSVSGTSAYFKTVVISQGGTCNIITLDLF